MSRPQKYALRAPKIKNDPEIKSNLKVRIEETIENESCPTTWADPNTAFEP